jgi:pimeloyl-ACP methyl ester carboxylesterase
MRFVLVHGGYHGAWCWKKFAPELEALGHEVLAIDLPGAGERMKERASLAAWRGAFREIVEDGDILVGHSQGGYGISLCADEVPDRVRRLIYLSAAVPIQGRNMHEASPDTNRWPETIGMPMEAYTGFVDLPEQGPCVVMTSPEAANKVFYHDCSPEDQAWAFDHLTPLPLAPTNEPFDIPRFWKAPIPRDFIMCTDDYSHPVSSDNAFMSRLGLTTCLSIVSSHSPFVSRPKELARLFDVCASGALSP